MSSHSLDSESSGLQPLLDRPYEYDFVQAVRQLYRHGLERSLADQRVGWDNFPEQEIVRFCVSTTLRHTACEVLSVTAPEGNSSAYVMTIPFMGLVGASGVLPRHYSRMVTGRVKKNDYAMRDFFDLFHHRIISNFFRASVKYRLPLLREMAALTSSESDDLITTSLKCLVGLGEPKTKNRLAFPDDACVFYAGHFSRKIPSAIALEQMLSEFIGLPTKVAQFQFEWLYIDPEEQSCLTRSGQGQLGLNLVIGERVPSFQSRFRIQIGPLKWAEFSDFQPESKRVKQISSFVRMYVGIGFDYDLQVSIDRGEIPDIELGGHSPSQLGWNSWVNSHPNDEIVTDAVFELG